MAFLTDGHEPCDRSVTGKWIAFLQIRTRSCCTLPAPFPETSVHPNIILPEGELALTQALSTGLQPELHHQIKTLLLKGLSAGSQDKPPEIPTSSAPQEKVCQLRHSIHHYNEDHLRKPLCRSRLQPGNPCRAWLPESSQKQSQTIIQSMHDSYPLEGKLIFKKSHPNNSKFKNKKQ